MLSLKPVEICDIYVINSHIYRVVEIKILHGLGVFTLQTIGTLPISIRLNVKDFEQLASTDNLYFLGNFKENEALRLLYV